MTTVVVSSLGGYHAQWDELVDLMPLPSPFLRSWWLEAASRHHPCFVLVCDGGRLLGGLALDERRCWGVSLVRMMGAGRLAPDHLDLVAAPGAEDQVIDEVGRWIGAGQRIVDFQGLVDRPRVGAALTGRRRREVIDIAPWIDLQGCRGRQSTRRAARRFIRRGGSFRLVTGPDCGDALRTLRHLHRLRWGAGSGFLADFDRFATAVEAGAGRGEVVFHQLVEAGRVIATSVWFEVAGRASFYQSGRELSRRFDGAGTALHAAAIERARRRGTVEIDLLRGDEAYKWRMATGGRPVVRLRAAHGVVARSVLTLTLGLEASVKALRRPPWARRSRTSL